MKNNCIIPVWKPAGWTPLKAVLEFKKNNQEFINRKISYAGRLDPMAEGILLFLADGENKKRREYEDLKKTYESEIILGIKTDSFDALGIIEKTRFESKLFKEQIKECLNTFIGKQKQFYPPYSSKAIEGKPLYWWARNKKLSEIKIPKREIEIYDISLESFDLIERKILVKKIIETIEIVEGEFRQKEIIGNWEKFAINNKNEMFVKIKIKVFCSSGTYIRRLASDLGKKLGSGAFAFSIKRTSVGKYKEKDCV